MTHPLKKRIGDKSILLVDDQYYTVGDYKLRLEDIDVASEHVETLDEALARIQSSPGRYGLALLDFNLPTPKSPTLQSYTSQLQLSPTSFNQGRCLGLHLWIERATLHLPYCYLSALSHGYGSTNSEFDGKEADFILDKAALLPRQLPDRLLMVLDKWNGLVNPSACATAGDQK